MPPALRSGRVLAPAPAVRSLRSRRRPRVVVLPPLPPPPALPPMPVRRAPVKRRRAPSTEKVRWRPVLAGCGRRTNRAWPVTNARMQKSLYAYKARHPKTVRRVITANKLRPLWRSQRPDLCKLTIALRERKGAHYKLPERYVLASNSLFRAPPKRRECGPKTIQCGSSCIPYARKCHTRYSRKQGRYLTRYE